MSPIIMCYTMHYLISLKFVRHPTTQLIKYVSFSIAHLSRLCSTPTCLRYTDARSRT